jgi:hypothetical protein
MKRLSHFRKDLPPLKTFHINIGWKNDIKYIGVILDLKLAYKSHTGYTNH